MSRNGTGTYVLPTGNPVVANTTITSTWANNTLNDIANALTQSLASDGQTPMTGNLNVNGNNINSVATLNATTENVTTSNVGDLNVSGTATFGGTVAGGTFTLPTVISLLEPTTISATAATGTINFDVITQAVVYFTTAASGNWTLNIRGNSGTSLNTTMLVNQSLSIAFMAAQGATPYYNSAVTIDGVSVTPKWQSGLAPSAGYANSVDTYTYTIIKTANATFTVLATQTKFA
jgi:hypothetical protein